MAADVFMFGEMAPLVDEVHKEAFPASLVEVTEGYKGRAHVPIVSPKLNGLSERSRQEAVWEVLRAELGDLAQAVSFVIAWGTDELR